MSDRKKPRYKLEMELEIGDRTVSLNNKKSRLLQSIDKHGSITMASEETGIPYRTALKDTVLSPISRSII